MSGNYWHILYSSKRTTFSKRLKKNSLRKWQRMSSRKIQTSGYERRGWINLAAVGAAIAARGIWLNLGLYG